jgi:hypothetical protein
MAKPRFQFFTRRTAAVEWRLVSANNWEIGRCAASVGSLEDCVAAVLTLQATIDGLGEEILSDGRGGWRWRLVRDDAAVVVAVASHSFQRRIECESTLAQFRKTAGDAAVVATLRILRRDGPMSTEM